MGKEDYCLTKSIINKYPQYGNFIGPISNNLILKAQKQLKVIFPPSYFAFIQDFGAGSFGSVEIYGIIGFDIRKPGPPNVVWLTEDSRLNFMMPSYLLPFYELGNGDIYCIDLRSTKVADSECEIIVYPSGSSHSNQKFEKIADDFGQLFLQLVSFQEMRFLKIKPK